MCLIELSSMTSVVSLHNNNGRCVRILDDIVEERDQPRVQIFHLIDIALLSIILTRDKITICIKHIRAMWRN